MRIVSWNMNSVRARLPLISRFTEEYQPDILCLQETKVIDNDFPIKALRKMGFEHEAIAGQKSYNGVAILSRHPLDGIEARQWCGRDDKRHIAATIQGVEIHNFYVPAGGDIPDPEQNDKFAHKLAFMEEMEAWSRDLAQKPGAGGSAPEGRRMVILGDFNVAPLESDVWSHKQLLKVVSHTPVEVDLLTRIQRAGEWVDAVRYFIPETEQLYSWWSYRARDWEKADKGRRLDHIWVTPALTGGLKAASVAKPARGWEKASDHAPVIIDLEP